MTGLLFICIFELQLHKMRKISCKAYMIPVLLAFIMTACEMLEDCKTCAVVTYESGVEVSRGPGILTCGDELEEKENASPVSIGGNRTTDYDCS